MRSFILLVLLNVSYINNVLCFKPNIFWNRAKTMTKFISGELYKRGKTMLKLPIVARTKITNVGFYDGNKKQAYIPPSLDKKFNGNVLYQGHASSGYAPNIPTLVSVGDEYKYTAGGLYEEYRKSMDVSQTLVTHPASSYNNGIGLSRNAPGPGPGPGPVSEYITENNVYSTDGLYEEYRKSLQKTNRESETMSYSTRKSANTSYGFYEGLKKSTDVKNDKVLYAPPNVVNTTPYLGGNNKFNGNGFYQGP